MTLIVFILIFAGSLAIIAITNNSLLAFLPASLLLAMRPIIRFIFPNDKVAQHKERSDKANSSVNDRPNPQP